MVFTELSKRFAASRFAATSLALHLLLIVLLGGVVLFKSVRETDQVFVGAGDASSFLTEQPEEPAGNNEDSEPQEFEEPAQPSIGMETPKALDAGFSALSTTEAAWSVNAPSDVYATGNSGVAGFGNSLGGIGNGGGKAGGGGKMGSPGTKTLFGTKVEASKLGALVDISGTATPFLHPTLREVQRNFTDCPIVLAVGCALSRSKGQAVPFDKVDMAQVVPQGTYTGVGYLQSTMAKNKDVDRLVRKLQTTPNVFLLENNGLDVGAAFEKLIESDVDGIYWFSDFRDGVNPNITAELSERLKKKGIKLYIHTFTGKPVPPDQTKMVETTGGKIISEIPK